MKYNKLRIEKTHDRIIDTEISSIKNIFCKINIKDKIIINEFMHDSNNDNNKCPANILAVNRIDRVHGRIIFLIAKNRKHSPGQEGDGTDHGAPWDVHFSKKPSRVRQAIECYHRRATEFICFS